MNSRSELPVNPVAAEPGAWRFGEFRLVPRERLLLRQGEPVALTARAFAVLAQLVERAGQLVSKDELMQRVWGGVVVEDNNIAVHVAQLRKALGAHAISTIPGCGYRFALPAAPEAQADAEPRAVPHDDAAPGNLPARLPPLIGRARELAELDAQVSAHPLVTLCGAAGIGKTQLAMTLALQRRTQHPDGVYWVELAPLLDAAAVVPAIARALGLQPAAGDDDPLAALTRRLKPRSLLLVLDNAEHLVDEAARVAAALLQGTRHLLLLVTSQVPLRVPGEQLVRLGPLALPATGDSPDQAAHCDALQLLAQRAAGAGGALEWDAAAVDAATRICRALDGNALAIELAGARLPALGLDGLATRLSQRFGLLAPAAHASPSRRNALAAAFDWSHSLLSAQEQLVFRRLAVFPGSFELDAAARCIADATLPEARAVEVILDLVDRSLVSVDRATSTRYRLLETGRLYAGDRLQASGEAPAARRAFARAMRALFDEAYSAHWRDPGPAWQARWEPELDNLRAALDEATQHDLETAVALYGAAWPLLHELLLLTEGRQRGDALVPHLHAQMPKALLARFWVAMARCLTAEYPQRCRAASETAARLYEELGDPLGEYLAWSEYAFNWRVDHPDARRALARAQALEDARWHAAVVSRGRTTEATLNLTSGRFEPAREQFRAVMALCERDRYVEGVLRTGANLADLERAAGQVEEAVRLGESMALQLPLHRATRIEFTVLGNLIGALVAQGRLDRADEIRAECARRMRRAAEDSGLWSVLDALALLHALRGRLRVAARLAGAADRAYREHGQHARQPNEAADRARLDALLTDQLSAEQRQTWQAEGELLDAAEAMQLALTPEPQL